MGKIIDYKQRALEVNKLRRLATDYRKLYVKADPPTDFMKTKLQEAITNLDVPDSNEPEVQQIILAELAWLSSWDWSKNDLNARTEQLQEQIETLEEEFLEERGGFRGTTHTAKINQGAVNV